MRSARPWNCSCVQFNAGNKSCCLCSDCSLPTVAVSLLTALLKSCGSGHFNCFVAGLVRSPGRMSLMQWQLTSWLTAVGAVLCFHIWTQPWPPNRASSSQWQGRSGGWGFVVISITGEPVRIEDSQAPPTLSVLPQNLQVSRISQVMLNHDFEDPPVWEISPPSPVNKHARPPIQPPFAV